MKTLGCVFAISLLGIVGIGVVFFISNLLDTVVEAEDNLQAFFQAQQATIKYIEANDGRWPRSWDDLSSIDPSRDFDWVAQRLTFDFDADPTQIVHQTPYSFNAIKPNSPCYVHDGEVRSIIQSLRKYHLNR